MEKGLGLFIKKMMDEKYMDYAREFLSQLSEKQEEYDLNETLQVTVDYAITVNALMAMSVEDNDEPEWKIEGRHTSFD